MAPVRPVQHYTMGGVRTDIECRAKEIEGLYAAGECGCWDMHGLARLGGNSLLETICAGFYAGTSAAKDASGRVPLSDDLTEIHSEISRQEIE